MAKKAETVSMIETFKDFKESQSIDRTTLVSVMEESFRSVIAKIFGSDENYDVIVNPDKGDLEIRRNREVVPDGEVTDPNLQISLSEAALSVVVSSVMGWSDCANSCTTLLSEIQLQITVTTLK